MRSQPMICRKHTPRAIKCRRGRLHDAKCVTLNDYVQSSVISFKGLKEFFSGEIAEASVILIMIDERLLLETRANAR